MADVFSKSRWSAVVARIRCLVSESGLETQKPPDFYRVAFI